ncbi:uncharacterized protein LOC124125270 [Haliotis rufescens]|uniref:uncharacterized protein LOC124125270 n=1 Tax=Haliotis rufescens TaxID=6454 RepID=UPI001EAFCF5C|nr:uncharacterized protein LOC124125270 [Haliotis rufescens]
MDVLLVFAVLTSLSSVSSLISPMKTSDGKVDLDSVLTHVLLLEQTVSRLTKAQCRKSDLDSLAVNVVNLNASLEKTKTQFKIEQAKTPRITDNKGGGYHATSGIFEAPVSGTYLFWANVMGYSSGHLHIALIKEGVTLVIGYSPY